MNSSTQERWDVVLKFHDGPLYYQGEVVCRGPVVRLGARPGPGGLVLDGYRGLDERQAVITAYDGGTVAIAPVGHNQVRVAPHGNVDWEQIQALKGPVYLSPGDVFHLGSPGRGATATFVASRRLGTWQQQRILSEADAAESIQPVNIKEIDAKRGIPLWFIPSVLVMGMGTMAAVALMLVPLFIRDPEPIGPSIEGAAYSIQDPPKVTAAEMAKIEPSLLDGLEGGFDTFVMAENAKASGQDKLRKNPKDVDPNLYKHVAALTRYFAAAWNFWRELDKIREQYAYVVGELSQAGMPTIFAAIPYWESRYQAKADSPVCARGHWQFMPETAKRVGLEVSGCRLRGVDALWSPTLLSPAKNLVPYAPPGSKCKIESCQVDQRVDLAENTRGAIQLLREAWDNEENQASGAAVQITILAHNAGFDDGAHAPHKKGTGLLNYYRKHVKASGKASAPDFYGQNIKCDPNLISPYARETTNERCGGVIPNQTQHYGYHIIAAHLLAVCYYATNYPDMEEFAGWKQFTIGNGYCTSINVPGRDKLYSQGKK